MVRTRRVRTTDGLRRALRRQTRVTAEGLNAPIWNIGGFRISMRSDWVRGSFSPAAHIAMLANLWDQRRPVTTRSAGRIGNCVPLMPRFEAQLATRVGVALDCRTVSDRSVMLLWFPRSPVGPNWVR